MLAPHQSGGAANGLQVDEGHQRPILDHHRPAEPPQSRALATRLDADPQRSAYLVDDPLQWLEKETGHSIPYVPDEQESEGRERHLSVRVDRLVRELLAQAVTERQSTAGLEAQALIDRLAADVAEVRRQLAG